MSHFACAFLPALLASAVLAQAHPEPAAVPAQLRIGRVPIHTAEPDQGVEYGLWAATDSYKASFHGDVTFIPYLGSRYQHNQTLAWRSLSVRVGELELLDEGVPERHCTAYRCELRFGRVTEAWDVLEQGLEQSFVIHARPAASGDLVVTGRIDSTLKAPDCQAAHRELLFLDAEGNQVVSYGKAFAIDAAGRRIAVDTAYEGGRVQLRVPAEWVAAAAFPVVVDPLLTRATLYSGVAPQSIDIARDDTGNDLMVTYARAASATDDDAYAILTTDTWSSMTTVFSDVNTWNTPVARVAVAADPQKFCIVLERHVPEGRRIRAHLHDSGDFTLQTSVVILTPAIAGSHDWRPDVGGQALSTSAFTSTGDKFLLVFQRDIPPGASFAETDASGIYGRLLSAGGTLGAEFPIALSIFGPTADHEYPNVNQQARRQGSAVQRTDWAVVFQHYTGPNGTWRTIGKLVGDDGVPQVDWWHSTGSGPTAHRLQPRVAGQAGRYLVSSLETAFTLAPFKTTATAGHSLVAERMDWSPGSLPVNYPSRLLDGPRTQANLGMGDVAYDSDWRSHWAITCETIRSAGGTGRATVFRVGYTGRVTESVALYTPTAVVEQGLCGGITYDSDGDVFVAAFGHTTGTVGSIFGNKLAWVTPVGAATSGVSCSSATVSWTGLQQIGYEFGAVRLSGAPPSVLAIAALSFGTLDQNLTSIGMTGCRLLIDNGPGFVGTVVTVSSAGGASSLPLALPETLLAMTFHAQWFHIDNGANPLNLVSTQRVSVNVVK